MRRRKTELLPSAGPSLRLRIALGTGLLVILVQVTTQLYSDRILTGEIETLFNWRFQVRGDILQNSLAMLDGPIDDTSLFRESVQHFLSGSEAWMTAVYNTDGTLVAATTRPAPPLAALGFGELPLVLGTETWSRTERRPDVLPGEHFGSWARVHVRAIKGPGGTPAVLMMAASDGRFENFMRNHNWVLAVSISSIVLASFLAAWGLAEYAVAPLRRMGNLMLSFSPATIRDAAAPGDRAPSEMRAFERQLMDARSQLREFLLAQDRLIANISHEVNTPIAIVLTEAQTIDQSELPASGRAFVASVQTEMRQLRRIVESLLFLSKLRIGGPGGAAPRWEINDVVMDAVRSVTPAAATASVVFSMKLDVDSDMVVDGDPGLVRVMLEHVLVDAVRHAGPGRAVSVATRSTDETCVIIITDGGEHPAADALAGRPDRCSAPGDADVRAAGSGLSIAQGLAELHMGRIIVTSREQGGCEYRVVFPLNAPTAVTAR